MFSSLRSRLLLTFAMVVAIVLCTATVMVVLITRNIPVRTATIRLQEVSRLIYSREDIADLPLPLQVDALDRIAARNNVRLLIVGQAGAVLFDSGPPEFPAIERIPPPDRRERGDGQIAAGAFRDADRRLWQYIMRPVDDRLTLVLAEPRPAVQWLTLLTDDLLPPLLWAAGFALLLAVLLAGLTARWVSRPLGAMAEASRKVPGGTYVPIEEDGPEEVRQLARAFNEMIEEVEAGRKSQRDFVANVSHELKTPLTGIQGFAQAILDGTAATGEEVQKAAGIIFEDAGRMHRLVLDLLDLARIEGGTLAFESALLDITALLNRLEEKFQPRCQEEDIRLIVHHAPLPPVPGDGDRLMQVFSNLLDNAIKHSPPGSEVKIHSSVRGDFVQLEWLDSGPGIPEDQHDRIFERFYQLDKSRARRQGMGFGLGLAIAKEIVQMHGGSIRVESRPGHGTNFVVQLPFKTTGGANLAADL